jgi:hypothetical protein
VTSPGSSPFEHRDRIPLYTPPRPARSGSRRTRPPGFQKRSDRWRHHEADPRSTGGDEALRGQRNLRGVENSHRIIGMIGVRVTLPLNRVLMRLTRRSENNDPEKLVNTFVDVGPLFSLLSSRDHQVFYGRRGTGKTHALLYLADQVRTQGDWPVYIDLRRIGSSGGIYSDESIPLPERGTRLLLDALGRLHDALTDAVLEAS